jgi:hypothetical protein
MKDELRKSLTDLIDETLLELEELKKSRFSASEIEIKGPGEGIAGKPTNGDLHAKAEDKKDDKKDDEDEEAEKAEGHNRQADPDGGHHKMDKDESGMPVGTTAKAEGHNRQADPDGGHHKMDKAEDKDDKDDDKKKKDKDAKGGEEHEKKEKEAIGKLANLAGMRKSDEEMQGLMKSFVEERVRPLEDKLSTILNLVNKIADQPVAHKGVTGRAVPLMKSADELGGGESLSKSEVASKLFELKKSGTKVDSLDITRAEMGHDLAKIVDKYKIS